jgi:hypothetical protein
MIELSRHFIFSLIKQKLPYFFDGITFEGSLSARFLIQEVAP